MIVGDPAQAESADRATLDDLFRRAAVRNLDALALADPEDRASFTDGAPRQLNYAQSDRIIWAIAAHLRALGLQTDSVVAFQLPNTVESVLVLLGILRAGLIAAPLPMLWRKSEIIAALSQVTAKALITTSHIGAANHCDIAMQSAADMFSVRYVCAFGKTVPDGVVSLHSIFSGHHGELAPSLQRNGNPAGHAAVITFEPAARGIQPVMRNHAQLIAGGMAVLAESNLAQNTALLSATPISSFAGLAVILLPWLLTGGALVLHQPFDVEVFLTQQRTRHCNAIVVPGSLAAAVADSGHFDDIEAVTMLALWRAPERPAREQWLGRMPLCDITAFGEFGLMASRRAPRGILAPMLASPVNAAVEGRRSAGGTLALRGPMVARIGLAAPEGHDALILAAADGFVDTGYPCRVENGCLAVTGPQPGMIGIGGYRIARGEIDAVTAALPADSLIAALPDALTGQRLKGRAPDLFAARTRLADSGVNPLIGGAFQTLSPRIP